MLKQDLIKQLAPKIESAVNELFDYAAKHEKNTNDYILFLANGTLDAKLKDPQLNPYTISYMPDIYKDETRIEFFNEYTILDMESQFNAIDQALKERFTHYVINLELMMYSHYWESTRNLKLLKQLALLVDGQDYNWDISIPDMGRHNFIRNEIRDVFRKHSLAAADSMSNGYRSQFRNAFAHSDYSLYKGEIVLHNFNEQDGYTVQAIPFSEWDERFTTTTLFFDIIYKKIELEKDNLMQERGTNEFVVNHLSRSGVIHKTTIIYDSQRRSFNFKTK